LSARDISATAVLDSNKKLDNSAVPVYVCVFDCPAHHRSVPLETIVRRACGTVGDNDAADKKLVMDVRTSIVRVYDTIPAIFGTVVVSGVPAATL